ncbi:DUF4097 family beta strand repeat-containing protein [Paenibacillus bovis]|uniref:DUF4097 domain-containing protein n=1 Tax=Paenibacillus bovis TaxID=1616788 RepID=A0A172ZGW7_9BACL|nr:DUF4097 family beta strand repeat-containing protein [Paenibacillus bovis]ANF96828.1 hypothetical protein AR543_12960 [Paenibacillus bovis]
MTTIRLNRKIVMGSLIIVLIVIGAISWLLYMNYISRPGTAHTQRWSAQPGELKHLQIDSDYEIAVEFEPSTDGKDSVQLHGDLSPYTISQLQQLNIYQQTLHLQLKQPHYLGNIWSSSSPAHVQYITVYLADPRHMESAEFQLSSSQTNLTDVTADRIIVHSGSGRIKAQQLKGQTQLYTSSGDILVQQWHGSQLNMESSSGNIRVNQAIGRTRSFTGSGQLHIERLDGEGQIESKSGDVEITPIHADILNIKTRSGNVQVHDSLPTAGKYDIQSDTGKIKLPSSPSSGQHYMHIRTTTGNITVDKSNPTSSL